MEQYNQNGNRFDYLVDVIKIDQDLIRTLQFRHLGECPVHPSLQDDKGLAQSSEHALAYGSPVKVQIEFGMILYFSTAQVAVTHKIDDEGDIYVIRHRGDAEDGVFYVPKEDPDCDQIMALLRFSCNEQEPFCFESKFNVVDTADGPFGRLEYTAIVFLDEDQGRQPV